MGQSISVRVQVHFGLI